MRRHAMRNSKWGLQIQAGIHFCTPAGYVAFPSPSSPNFTLALPHPLANRNRFYTLWLPVVLVHITLTPSHSRATMGSPPNELYTAFSFIGFAFCAIPFYWHLEAWNAGTCLYMAWVGLGCLMQCINSIVWNKNTSDKAPVYSDISTRIQVGLNVAIPASSLCINRRLYKVATAKGLLPAGAEKRRAVVTDLLIGLGIPILQMIVRESIYAFYWRRQQFKEIMSSNPGFKRGRYIRLMAISSVEILGTIPVGTYLIVNNARHGVTPWMSWDHTHSNYSQIVQVPSSVWKDGHGSQATTEIFRWSLVLCAFLFFGFFGFADEARQNYRRAFAFLASRIGHLTSWGTRNVNETFYATSTLPGMKNSTNDLTPEFKIEQHSASDSMVSSSVDGFEPEIRDQSSQPTASVPPVSVPPHWHVLDEIQATIHTSSSDAADTV
ncbi:pheromone A receptor-domain-containing protein [Russula brevipes]|nr:pheromone A receptor-domain-containing protein [Russula brevipes]